MTLYKCECGEVEKQISKSTIVLREGRWVVKEALCDCGIYMKQVYEDKHKGMPHIIRNERNGK